MTGGQPDRPPSRRRAVPIPPIQKPNIEGRRRFAVGGARPGPSSSSSTTNPTSPGRDRRPRRRRRMRPPALARDDPPRGNARDARERRGPGIVLVGRRRTRGTRSRARAPSGGGPSWSFVDDERDDCTAWPEAPDRRGPCCRLEVLTPEQGPQRGPNARVKALSRAFGPRRGPRVRVNSSSRTFGPGQRERESDPAGGRPARRRRRTPATRSRARSQSARGHVTELRTCAYPPRRIVPCSSQALGVSGAARRRPPSPRGDRSVLVADARCEWRRAATTACENRPLRRRRRTRPPALARERPRPGP
jgi:hypothetical protein